MPIPFQGVQRLPAGGRGGPLPATSQPSTSASCASAASRETDARTAPLPASGLCHLGHTQMDCYAHALPKFIHEGVAETASRPMLAD